MIKINTWIIALASLFTTDIVSQQREFIGGKGSNQITVTASHSFSISDASKTIDGTGLDSDLMAASRFLYQAAMGG